MTRSGLSALFRKRTRAKLKRDEYGEELRLHDLRRVATTEYLDVFLDEKEKLLIKNGHMGKNYDEVYLTANRERHLSVIQDKLDKGMLSVVIGKDQWGEDIRQPMTLREFASQGLDHKVTNEEIFKGLPFRFFSPIPGPNTQTRGDGGNIYRTRWDRAKSRLEEEERKAKADPKADRKVYVIQVFNADGSDLEHERSVGYMGLKEAIDATKIGPDEISDLMFLDTLHPGVFRSENGYFFFSEAWLRENLAVFSYTGSVEDWLENLQQDGVDVAECVYERYANILIAEELRNNNIGNSEQEMV